MTSNYVRMTRKVPQTDSTDPYTFGEVEFSCTGATFNSWRAVKTLGKYAASSLSSPTPLCLSSNQNAKSAKTDPSVLLQILLRQQQQEEEDGMMETTMKQKMEAGQNNLTRPGFLLCSLFSVYKGRLPTCHSHSGSLSTAAREAPPNRQNGEREKQTNKQLVKAHIYMASTDLCFSDS